MDNWILYIVEGALITVKYSLISVVFGLFLGTIIAFMRLSNNSLLKSLTKIYVSILRGTPILLQLSFAYYVLPSFLDIKISVFIAGVISFSVNSSAYVSEIIRAGILSVDKGQFEAANVLGIPKYLMMKDIIMPQAFRNILPALINEFVSLIKESSILAMIGEADLMRRAQIVASVKYTYFEPLLVAGVCYYILVITLSTFGERLEKRLHDKY